MRRPLIAALAGVLMLSACGWGGHRSAGPETLAPKGGYPTKASVGPLVPQVLSVKVERTPSGAIVRATGLPPTQGYWGGSLVADNNGDPDENGVMTYRFVLIPPPSATAVSTQASREVTVGAFIRGSKLRRVRQIVVEGKSNRLTARR